MTPSFCDLAMYCKGEKHEDFCGNPVGKDVWESYCIRYREIKQALVEGAEEILKNWEGGLSEARAIDRLFKSEEGVYIGGMY